MTAGANVQCAIVRHQASAHSHNTQESSPEPCTLPAHSSLKALAGVVLGHTLPRTSSAKFAQSSSTLGALRTGDPRKSEYAELAALVRQCGEAYGFTEAVHAEALAEALADPRAALTCYRDIAADLGLIMLLDDERRTCDQCENMIGRQCQAAKRGDIVASRDYEPIRDLPRRCEGYIPGTDDPDRRLGWKRWPGLI